MYIGSAYYCFPCPNHFLSIVNPSSELSELNFSKIDQIAVCWWLTPVILAIQEAEIRRIMV
jgi:hypothetical protein